MFAAPELAELKKLQGQAFLERFLVYWTLREAYCKALGVGIAHAGRGFCFVAENDGSYGIRFESQSGGHDMHWHFTITRPGTDHMVAVAVRSEDLSGREVIQRFIVP